MKYLWVSDNEKWAIEKLHDDNGLTIAWVIDLKNRKGFEVMVEHIKKGQKLLYGIASETHDNFVTDVAIPKYLQNKIIQLKEELR